MKAPFISTKEIWEKADKFRQEFANNECPVQIIEIAEMKLGLRLFPQPNLKAITDGDAFITSDFSTIYVDKQQFDNPNQNRIRFSVAHEVGHYVLHRKFGRGMLL